jgi:TRAP-type C4-dicarboxylate transport system permease small subunit
MARMNENTKMVLKVLGVMLCFYLLLMVVWNVTNTNNKPSSFFWDWDKEGYQPDPLYDRGGNR